MSYLDQYRGARAAPSGHGKRDEPAIQMDDVYASLTTELKWMHTDPCSRFLFTSLFSERTNRNDKEAAELRSMRKRRADLTARANAERFGRKASAE